MDAPAWAARKEPPRMKTFRNPPAVHPPLAAYAHQVELRGPERMLILAGQVGVRPDGSLPAGPLEQLQEALANVERNLAAAGMAVTDLVKLTLYVAGAMDTAGRRSLTAAWLRGHTPCTTMLYVAGLASPDYKVEIDAWASRAESA
jgi:enamine deaminase RidA (YjgF/YER057c/UK114 family)